MSSVASNATLEASRFRSACALFATGIAVLTTRASDGAPHGITVNSFASLSLAPPLVMVAIDRACVFLNFFESSGFYAVNILAEDHRHLSRRFSELPENRFDGVGWTAAMTGSPRIGGALAMLDCKIVQKFDAGDHRVLIGEVQDIAIGEGRPLIYFSSDYAELKPS